MIVWSGALATSIWHFLNSNQNIVQLTTLNCSAMPNRHTHFQIGQANKSQI